MTSSLATDPAMGPANFVEAGSVATPTGLQAKAAKGGAVTCSMNAQRFRSVRPGVREAVRAHRGARRPTH